MSQARRRKWMPQQKLQIVLETLGSDTKLAGDACPTIQSDYGSGFAAREFAETLGESGVTHRKIRPHTPTDNAEIERYHRTIGDRLGEEALEAFAQAESVVDGIIDWYNHRRLHSALLFLRPVDYYRGDPEALLAEPRRAGTGSYRRPGLCESRRTYGCDNV